MDAGELEELWGLLDVSGDGELSIDELMDGEEQANTIFGVELQKFSICFKF
jgi:hypothetical protein